MRPKQCSGGVPVSAGICIRPISGPGGAQRGRNGPPCGAPGRPYGGAEAASGGRVPPPARRDARRTGLVPPGAIAAMASRSPSGVSRYRQAGRRFNTRYCALMWFGRGVCGGRNASWVLPPADSASVRYPGSSGVRANLSPCTVGGHSGRSMNCRGWGGHLPSACGSRPCPERRMS